MCSILFAWRPDHPLPLVLAANRDEFYARPAAALSHWGDSTGIIAGRDLEAGGTWLGLQQQGRFAALTNIRDPKRKEGRYSRGELVSGFLQSTESPMTYLERIAKHSEHYAGFNLLVGDTQQLCFLNAYQGHPKTLEAGVYGLSNANLNTPWPKVMRARAALDQCLTEPSDQALLALLADPWTPADELLPDTGIGLELERLLASTFIQSDYYGTRASTALRLHQDGRYEVFERSFGPHGQAFNETKLKGQFAQAYA